MLSTKMSRKGMLALVLLWIPLFGNYAFAEDAGKLLYKGEYKDPGISRDLDTGFESVGVEMVLTAEIYENWVKIGIITGNYAYTTRSSSRVYKGSDSLGNRITIYVTDEYEIYYDTVISSPWGTSTCRTNLKQL